MRFRNSAIMPEAKFAGLTLLLGAMLISSHIAASEYCSKEQYQLDRALIENANECRNPGQRAKRSP
jgi:hypothetical protein